LARYLIEDNNEEHVIFDIHRSCDDRISLDIIKKLIGRYELFESSTNEAILTQMKEVLFFLIILNLRNYLVIQQQSLIQFCYIKLRKIRTRLTSALLKILRLL
jgi:hypothetical protein